MIVFGLNDVIAEDLVLRDLSRCLENFVVNSPQQHPRPLRHSNFESFPKVSSYKPCNDCVCPRIRERRAQEPREELTVDTRYDIIETIDFYAGSLFVFQG